MVCIQRLVPSLRFSRHARESGHQGCEHCARRPGPRLSRGATRKSKWGSDHLTKLLDQAVEAARGLSPEAQDDIAHVVLRLAGADDEPPVTLTPEEPVIAAAKAAAAR